MITATDIARALGVRPETVKRYERRLGILRVRKTLRERGTIHPNDARRIIAAIRAEQGRRALRKECSERRSSDDGRSS